MTEEQEKTPEQIMADGKGVELEVRLYLAKYPERTPPVFGEPPYHVVHDAVDGFNCHRRVEDDSIYLYGAWTRAYERARSRVEQSLELAVKAEGNYVEALHKQLVAEAELVVWNAIHPDQPGSKMEAQHQSAVMRKHADDYTYHVDVAKRNVHDLDKPYYGMCEFIHGLPEVNWEVHRKDD